MEEDEGGSAFEAAYDAGFWNPDEIDELRDLIKLWEFPDPFPRVGNKNDAILIMLDHKLHPQPTVYSAEHGTREPVEDPHVTWAKALLSL